MWDEAPFLGMGGCPKASGGAVDGMMIGACVRHVGLVCWRVRRDVLIGCLTSLPLTLPNHGMWKETSFLKMGGYPMKMEGYPMANGDMHQGCWTCLKIRGYPMKMGLGFQMKMGGYPMKIRGYPKANADVHQGCWTCLKIRGYPMKMGGYPMKMGDYPMKMGGNQMKIWGYPTANADVYQGCWTCLLLTLPTVNISELMTRLDFLCRRVVGDGRFQSVERACWDVRSG